MAVSSVLVRGTRTSDIKFSWRGKKSDVIFHRNGPFSPTFLANIDTIFSTRVFMPYHHLHYLSILTNSIGHERLRSSSSSSRSFLFVLLFCFLSPLFHLSFLFFLFHLLLLLLLFPEMFFLWFGS